jgi:Tfp pilus assembly protein PilF
VSKERVSQEEVARLERNLDWALKRELPNPELVRMLRAFLKHATGTDPRARLARLELSERLLTLPNPRSTAWESVRLAQEVLSQEHDPTLRARAYGVLGVGFTLLECYRAARRAYYSGLRCDPGHPVIAHNLGQLLAAVFQEPALALRWLERAHAVLDHDVEVAASLAWALCRLGRDDEARATLTRGFAVVGYPEPEDAAQRTLQRWHEASKTSDPAP